MIPDISHVVVRVPEGVDVLVEVRLVDQLDLARIGLSVTTEVQEAGRVPPGAVVVNAVERLPLPHLLDGMTKVFVEDEDPAGGVAIRLCTGVAGESSAEPQRIVFSNIG